MPTFGNSFGCQQSFRPARQQFSGVKPVTCDGPKASLPPLEAWRDRGSTRSEMRAGSVTASPPPAECLKLAHLMDGLKLLLKQVIVGDFTCERERQSEGQTFGKRVLCPALLEWNWAHHKSIQVSLLDRGNPQPVRARSYPLQQSGVAEAAPVQAESMDRDSFKRRAMKRPCRLSQASKA